MEPAGLTSLPVELIHHITRYLSVQDVLACSLTCHCLRNVLNDNSVWKKYLPNGISCLETKQQLVSPSFQMGEILSPLCENRQHFARRTHLINNWKGGKCVQFRSNSDFTFRSGVFNKTKGMGEVIYDDKYIFLGRFINDIESDGIEVWEISNTPESYTFLKIKYKYFDCFFIIGCYLVVVECIKVFVYRITLPEKDFPLEFSFLITEQSVTFKERIERSECHNSRCTGWYHSIVNNCLISNRYEENVIHIWDIKSAHKIGSFEPAIATFSIRLHSFMGKDLLFKFQIQSSSTHYLSVFDFDKLQFTGPMFSYSNCIHIVPFHPYVILFKNAHDPNPDGWYDNICSIYEFNSSLKLKDRRFDNATKNYMLDSITIMNGIFVILCNDGFHIVDALSLETVDIIECNNIKFITKQIFLYNSSIVVACNSNNKLELWDIGLQRRRKLAINLKEVYTSHLYLDKHCTKLVTTNYSYVSVVHFW